MVHEIRAHTEFARGSLSIRRDPGIPVIGT